MVEFMHSIRSQKKYRTDFYWGILLMYTLWEYYSTTWYGPKFFLPGFLTSIRKYLKHECWMHIKTWFSSNELILPSSKIPQGARYADMFKPKMLHRPKCANTLILYTTNKHYMPIQKQ